MRVIKASRRTDLLKEISKTSRLNSEGICGYGEKGE
jgi:hypothetical protein